MFFNWSFGLKVAVILKYIFQYTKYVLGNHCNSLSRPPAGMELVISRSVALGDQSIVKWVQLSAVQTTWRAPYVLTNCGK